MRPKLRRQEGADGIVVQVRQGHLQGLVAAAGSRDAGLGALGPAAAFSVIYFLVILLLCWLFYSSVVKRDA